MLIWTMFVFFVLTCVLLHFEGKSTREFYAEIYQNKMHITKEYTRRVISDVYVAVINNIYYLEHTLDEPDAHKETMARIVKSGTRVRSCGISFIEDYYYPKKEHRFCPFAWRNATNPEIVYTQDMGDADLDYLYADWFRSVIDSDSAQWSEPFYDGYDEKTTLSAYMAPIHDQTGRVVAVLGADVSLDWLTSKLNEADSAVNKSITFMSDLFEIKSDSYILYNDGRYLTNADENSIMKDNIFSHLEPCDGSDVEELAKKFKAGTESDGKTPERFIFNGEECFLFYTPVKYTQWILVTAVPCHDIDMMGYLNVAVVLLLVLLAMLVVWMVGNYYVRNWTEPVKSLIKLADGMAEGRYDTPVPELKYNDEICQLRDSMEKMQFTLSNYADEVERSAATREKR